MRVLFALVGLSMLLVPTPREASAATFTDPWWDNVSPEPECVDCGCGCPKPSLWSAENMNFLTGESMFNFHLLQTKGMVQDFPVSIMWRGYIDGMTQVGNSAVLSFEHTVQYVELNPQNPNGNGGHEVIWNRPDGLQVTYDWDGVEYSTQDCSITHVLTHNSPYKLTDKQGNEMLFDTNGMPDTYTDRNGNELDFTYNSSYQITGLTDTRGGSWSFSHTTDGFLGEIQDPCGRTWTLTYDTNVSSSTSFCPAEAGKGVLIPTSPQGRHGGGRKGERCRRLEGPAEGRRTAASGHLIGAKHRGGLGRVLP